MKSILLVSFIYLLSFGATPKEGDALSVTKVYICTGKYSKKYHYRKKCRGLSNCKSDIIEVYLNEAKHKGRTLCGWED